MKKKRIKTHCKLCVKWQGKRFLIAQHCLRAQKLMESVGASRPHGANAMRGGGANSGPCRGISISS